MRRASRVLAASAVGLSLLLTACGSDSDPADPTTPDTSVAATDGATTDPAATDGAAAAGGEIVIRGCTPENPLVPGNTSETCGGDMVDAMTAKLVEYDTETSDPIMDIAESIESDDNVTFTVKLKEGYLFHDGTEVKAHNFVDAWNYTAAYDNGQAGAYFMSVIKGAYEMAEEGSTTTELEGLNVVDDYTFTIETTGPVGNLPVRLGYSAFAPMPDSFFEDPAAFEDAPIGAGPFKFESKSTTEYVFSKFTDYSGENVANVDQLTFRIYTDPAAAYADVVANNLDYTNEIPADVLVGEQYKADLPDRNLERESLRFTTMVFSPNDPQLADNVDLRRSISMAIDRQLIIDQIYNGTYTAAHGWAPKVVAGANDTACGEWCDFDPEAAKALYDEAGGYDGTLTITTNGDGAHKEWTEAVCNSIKNTLDVECIVNLTVDFATYNQQIDNNEIMGLFRSGWQGDYPSLENFLAPIYGTGADSNWSQYSNQAFDDKLAEANAADTTEAADALYAEAEDMLGEDLPTAPLWYPRSIVGFSDRVENVQINAFGVLDFSAISVKQ